MQRFIDFISRRAARCFLAGLFAVLPLVITVAVVTWVGNLVLRFLGPSTVVGGALRRVGLQFATNATAAYVIGTALVLAVIFAIGVAVEAGAKNLVQRLCDALVQRIPVVGSVYGTSKQLVGLIDKKPDANLQGMRAVFCLFGGQAGVGVLGLLVSPQRFCINDREYHIVIVPTAPVPVGGGLLFVPVEMVRPADVSVEAVVGMYVSMGVTAPQFLPHADRPEQR